jgi:hypothetical protein
MEDIKIKRICFKLNIKDLKEFKFKKHYLALIIYLNSVSPSTAEDYIWRLHRALQSAQGVSVTCVKKYKSLLLKYKKLYR